MIRFSHYKDVPYPLEKIKHLYNLLKNGAKDYELFIASVDIVKMKDILNRLALTTDQFASTIYLKVNSLTVLPGHETQQDSSLVPQNNPYVVDTFIYLLIDMEKMLVTAYRDVLNQPFTDIEFRRELNFQLSEMLFLFMHLKLMNSLKVKMY